MNTENNNQTNQSIQPQPVTPQVTPQQQPSVQPTQSPQPQIVQQTTSQPVQQPIQSPPSQTQNSNPQQGGVSITESTKATVQNIKDSVTNILSDVNDVSSTFSPEDIKEGKVMGILSYIGILVLVPFFFETNNQFVVYHAKQGMNLFIYGFGTAIVFGMLTFIFTMLIPIFGAVLSTILWLAHLGFFGGLIAIGIVNVCNNRAKELPIINKIKIIK